MDSSKQEVGSFSSIEFPEDGPLFRATISHLESRNGILKTRLKRIIKATTASLEARRQMTRADEELMDTLREIDFVEPLMRRYLNEAWSKITEERHRLDNSLSAQLLEPIKQLYEQEIKIADLKRRQFEEESKDYYAVLAKYLKRAQANHEDKQLARKLKFDLARFDYLEFLVDMHGGRKEHDILLYITNHVFRELNYFESIAQNIASAKPGLDFLIALLSENSLKYAFRMEERANKRKELESTITLESPEKKRRSSLPEISYSTSSSLSAEAESPIVNEDRFKGFRDLEQPQIRYSTFLGRKKEGFLFATSKPSKSSGFDVKSSTQTWHKYWCVLSGGQLYEYTNWKKQLEPHNDPINLRFATVREARNSDRRFCFEVITPLMRRIYQATSQEEAEYWISTIQNSIESVLNGTSSCANLKDLVVSPSTSTPLTTPTNKKKRSSRHVRSLSVVLKSVASDRHSDKLDVPCLPTGTSLRSRWSGFHFGNNNKPAAEQCVAVKPSNESLYVQFDESAIKELLDTLRLDQSNRSCADCGASDPDWCSLNLGILLCIECSGIHRSLGTHISKVRSLKLDSVCYTPEIVSFLSCMGNAHANAIWDPRPSTLLSCNSGREEKLAYVQAKYVDRAFADKKSPLNQALFEAVDQEDISKTMDAIKSIHTERNKIAEERKERERQIEPSLKELASLNYVTEEDILDMISAPS